jgi:hypothetical protein
MENTKGRGMYKNKWIQKNIVRIVEQIPLMLFVAVQNLGLGIEARIIIGGVLSLPVLIFIIIRKPIITATMLGVNIFLFICMLILLSPFDSLSDVLLNIGEPVMIVIIVLCNFTISVLKLRKYSYKKIIENIVTITTLFLVLITYLVCIVLTFYYRGNEILAGAIPVVMLLVSEKILNYSLEHNLIEVSNARS